MNSTLFFLSEMRMKIRDSLSSVLCVRVEDIILERKASFVGRR